MNYNHISVIICTYNRKHYIAKALRTLLCQNTNDTFSYDLIIIDDASTDGTSQIVEAIKKETRIDIKYIKEAGSGIAKARNRGIDESSGGWLVFADDDQMANSDWLAELFATACKYKALCVGGKRRLLIPDPAHSKLSSICRKVLGEINFGNESFRCDRKTVPSGGNVLIRRTIFETIGQFNESLKCGGSDLEFFRRMHFTNIDCWYTPKAMVHHIIPEYRLQKGYLLWKSLINGVNFANCDCVLLGAAKATIACSLRVFQAIFIIVPLILYFYFIDNEAEILGKKCLLWRQFGYTRKVLSVLFPKLLRQEQFFSQLEFRKERVLFKTN